MLFWDELINLLSQVLENYKMLLDIGKNKRGILVSANVDELINITKQEEEIVLKIGRLEALRVRTMQEIASFYKPKGINLTVDETRTLSKIKKLADKDTQERLEEIILNILNVVNELALVNELNNALIAQSLNFIDFNINILSVASCGPTYTGKPQEIDESQIKRRSILDAKA